MNLETLIAAYNDAQSVAQALHTLWDRPVCGVPGFGFKAARKARRQIVTANNAMIIARDQLRNYVRGDTKLSYKRRQTRLEAIQRAIPTFTL